MDKLPDKWCILRTPETWKIITDFMNENYGTSYSYNNPGFPYVSNSVKYNDSRSYVHPGHTLITFEDFKRLVLKQDTMNTQDKIKQLEEELNKLKEEVKKETEFKIGDWVIVKSTTQGGHGNGISTDNLVSQLYKKGYSNATGKLFEDANFSVKEGRFYYNILTSHIIRKATPEEIAKATNKAKELYFGSTKVIIKQNSSYAETQYGNISKTEIKEIIDFFEQDFTILGHKMQIVNEGKWFIKFGCQKDSLNSLKEIYKAFD